MPPEPRPYQSAKRDAAAAAKRQQVLDAAGRLLAEGPATLSMDSVARAAGVTRLTVYKQFGSRRGLLEAVFDDNAQRGGITRIAEAMRNPNPRAALDHAIDILCDFWGSHASFAKLHDAAAVDPEFAEAIDVRNARRRTILTTLVNRMSGTDAARAEAADLLFGLTAMPMFRLLGATRPPAGIAETLKLAANAILDRLQLT